MYVEKKKTWKDNWNDVVRYHIFADAKMRELMCLPKDVTIPQFCEKYFIRDGDGTDLLTDEKVRIIYNDSPGVPTRNRFVTNRRKEFDIYVKEEYLHPTWDSRFSDDWMKCRYDVITERLKILLCNGAVFGLKFYFEDEYDQWTKTPGYKRYRVIFSYQTTV